jgi:hypothetical protein
MRNLLIISVIFLILTGCKKENLEPVNSLKGWQIDENNIGLAGVGINPSTLPLYTGTNKPLAGTVIKEMRIEQQMDLSNGNITIERCLIKPLSIGRGLPIIWNYNIDNLEVLAVSAFIRDCDFDCTAIPAGDIGWSAAFAGSGVIERCNIFGCGSGLWLRGISPIEVRAENNYIHGLRHSDPDSHQDGLTIRDYTGPQLIVRNNRIDATAESETGPCFIQAGFGYVDNILIEGNLLEGNNWKLILEAGSKGYGNNLKAINNRFRNTGYGAGYVSGGNGWEDWQENYMNDPIQVDNKGQLVAEPMP